MKNPLMTVFDDAESSQGTKWKHGVCCLCIKGHGLGSDQRTSNISEKLISDFMFVEENVLC